MATTGNQDTTYLYPSTWNNLADTSANYAAGFPSYLNQIQNNWYDNPLTTGVTPEQQSAFTDLGNSNFQQQAQPNLQQAGGLYQAGANYDPAKLQQYLNPYQQGANVATTNLSNQNLFEKVLPGVNSTFTGAGQFGSSRNADFTNRAIRDQQQSLSNTLANANLQNYQNANQNYLAWAGQNNQAAQGLAGLASQNAQLGQQDLTNQMTAATNKQQLEQSTLDKSYQDWMTKQQFPLTGLTALSGAMGNMAKGVQPNISTPVSQPDDVSRVLAAVQAMSSGLNDASVQSMLAKLFPTS